MAKKEILNNDVVTLRVGEAAVDAVDSVVDTVENAASDVVETVENIVTITKNNPFLIAGAFIVGAGIGAFVAYKITQKRLEAKFDEELSEQIAAARSFTKRLAKEGEFESPESAVKALVPDEIVDQIHTYQGRETPVPYNKPEKIDPRPPVEQVVVEEVVNVTNVFVEAEKNEKPDVRDWDYNAEIADRELNPDVPYAISFEEFNENEPGHEQTTLTYYAMDDTLADTQDKPVDNTEYTVGDDNLNRFGDGSGDPNIVYVRNEKISMDFEVVRSNGSYQREVLGMDPDNELQHSRRRVPRQSWRADE